MITENRVERRRRLYRPNEIKEDYGISRDLVFKLLADGQFEGGTFLIGRARFITAEAIENYIERLLAEQSS